MLKNIGALNKVLLLCLGLLIQGRVLAMDGLTESFFYNYSTEDGLINPLCNAIAEDSEGYIWIGTPQGLVRFDGVFFETFNDKNSVLSEKYITSIHQCRDGNSLLVGTLNGMLYSVNLNNIEFTPVSYDPAQINLTGIGSIIDIFEINKNLILVATERNGLLKIERDSKRISYINEGPIENVKRLSVVNIRYINNVLYVAARQGLYVIKEDENHKIKLTQSDLQYKNTSDVAYDTDSTIFVSAANKLLRVNTNTFNYEVMQEFPSILTGMVKPMSGNLWFSTFSNGLFRYNMKDGSYSHYMSGKSTYGLDNNNIRALMYSSRNDLVWAGSRNGIVKVDNRYNNVKYFDMVQYSETMSANMFMIKVDSQNDFWVWSTDGLYRKKNKINKFEKIKPSSTYQNNDTIYQAVEDEQGNMLFSSSRGVLKYDKKRDRFAYLPIKGIKYCSNIVNITDSTFAFLSNFRFTIYNKKDGSERVHRLLNYDNLLIQGGVNYRDSLLWIGSNHGVIFKFDIAADSISEVLHLPVSDNLKSLPSISVIKTDKFGNLWIATNGDGLIKYDVSSKTFTHILTSDGRNESIYLLEQDKNGNLWFHNSLGIVSINPYTGQQKLFGSNYYILCPEFNQGASSVTPDGRIVMGGSNGFNVIDTDELKRPSHNYKPVIASARLFKNSSHYYDIDQQQIIYNPKDTLYISEEYESLYIYVRILNFLNSKKSKIAWKIDGVDPQWKHSTVGVPIIYSVLPPGTFKMTILSLDDDGNPMGEPLEIVIVRKVFFYQHPLFKVLVVLMAIGFIVFYFLNRNSKLAKRGEILNKMVAEKTIELSEINVDLNDSKLQIERQNKELEMHRIYLEDLVRIRTIDLEKAKLKAEESDKLKSAFLANLSHEIRTPMNSIMGFSTLLSTGMFNDEEQKEFVGNIQSSSESLLVLINDIVDVARIETNQVSLVKSKVEVCKDLVQIIKSLKFEKMEGAPIGINIDDSCQGLVITTDKERFKQIVQNLVNNAIKFSSHGNVSVSASIILESELPKFDYNHEVGNSTRKLLLVTVTDDGIGIAEEDQKIIFEAFRKLEHQEVIYPGIGLGLSIVKDIVSLLNGKVWVKSKLGQGSTFRFYIPAE